MMGDGDSMWFGGGFMWVFKKRYARGEIDEQEYEHKRKELEG